VVVAADDDDDAIDPGQCLPGSFSSTGLEPCETCPLGYYQPHYAETSCLPCPPGMTTWRRGTRQLNHCRGLLRSLLVILLVNFLLVIGDTHEHDFSVSFQFCFLSHPPQEALNNPVVRVRLSASLSVSREFVFSPLYLLCKWSYFNETGHSYSLPGPHDIDDNEKFTMSKVKVSHRNPVFVIAPGPLNGSEPIHCSLNCH